MTEILHVDPETKPDAIRRRLARLDSGPVAVVLPEGWSELDNLARLRLLQRQARLRDQHLALVTQHFETRQTAKKLGIPVFGNEAALLGRSWRMHNELPDGDPRDPAAHLPEPPPWRSGTGRNGSNGTAVVKQVERPSLRRSRQRRIAAEERFRRATPLWLRLIGYGLVGLLLIGVLSAFFYFVLPAATVTVVPGQRQIQATAELTANPAVEQADLALGIIPARLMETYVEVSGSIPTSGREQAATARAQGTIVFTNQTNRTVRIPAGTIVSTSTGDRVDFRTLSDVELPGPTGTRVSVAIEAMEEGTRGNVRANTITTVSGALRTQVQATNPNATGGGASDLVAVVKQEDRDQLLEQLYAQVQENAYERLLPELRPNEWLPRESVQTFIVSQFFDHFNDEPAEELNLTLRVLIQGVAVNRDLSEQAAMEALEEATPARAKLVADSIQFFVEPGAVVNNRAVTFRILGQGNYVIPIDTSELRSAIAGLTPEEAAAVLQRDWLLARPPDFYQDPDWFGTLPQFGSRIQVRVQYEEINE